MGLPGSGKTYLTQRLVPLLNAAWYNADQVRKMSNDWDFSNEGRKRQSMRMKAFADFEKSQGRNVICDFVAPTNQVRDSFAADCLIWVDTFKEGRVVSEKLNQLKDIDNLPFDAEQLSTSKKFDDTNKMFENPENPDIHVTSFLSDEEIKELVNKIKNV